MRIRLPLAIAALAAVFAFTPASTIAQNARVSVDCGAGDSINRALTRRANEPFLIVEISGTCTENVMITRGHVVLRGSDAAQDGIVADATVPGAAAVWVRGADLVRVESLRLTSTGGPAVRANAGELSLVLVTLEGPFVLSDGANVQLFGVTQFPAVPTNRIDGAADVRLGAGPVPSGPTPSSVGGMTIGNFSTLATGGTSQINGDLVCSQGGNAFCGNPAFNVTGTSNCALCPKP